MQKVKQILVLIVFILVIVFFYMLGRNRQANYDLKNSLLYQEIERLEDENIRLRSIRDSIQDGNKRLVYESSLLEDQIKNRVSQIEKLKQQKNEEIDRIKYLSLDDAILFLARSLSEEP